MKSIITIFALLLSFQGFADVQDALDPVSAYKKLKITHSNQELNRQIQTLVDQGFESIQIQSSVLTGVCGFIGCSDTHLVIDQFETSGANPRTHSILALVSYEALTLLPRVTLVPVEMTNSLINLTSNEGPSKCLLPEGCEEEKPVIKDPTLIPRPEVCLIPEGCHTKVPENTRFLPVSGYKVVGSVVEVTVFVPCGVETFRYSSSTMNSTRVGVLVKDDEAICRAVPRPKVFKFNIIHSGSQLNVLGPRGPVRKS